MKNLKKTLSLVLCLMMALALLASCGGKKDETDTAPEAEAVTATPAAEPTPAVVTELTPADLILGVWELSEVTGSDADVAELAELKARGAAITCTFTKTDMTFEVKLADAKNSNSVPYAVEDGKIVYGDRADTYVLEEKTLTLINPENEEQTMIFTLKQSMVPVTAAPATN